MATHTEKSRIEKGRNLLTLFQGPIQQQKRHTRSSDTRKSKNKNKKQTKKREKKAVVITAYLSSSPCIRRRGTRSDDTIASVLGSFAKESMYCLPSFHDCGLPWPPYCTCTCVCTCMYVHVHLCMCVCEFVSVCAFMYKNACCVCMFMCVCGVCVFACMWRV